MVGAAGISAFPMASRIVHQMGVKEDKSNYLLMHAASANIAGQVASAIAGGIVLTLFLQEVYMKAIGINMDHLMEAINAAWKGYLALFIAMAIIFIGIAILNKVTNLKKSK